MEQKHSPGSHSDASRTLAAIYLRVSTESQNYSTKHQRAAITQYAVSCGLQLVREYVDEGKSGLDIRRRAGLSQLVRDVQAGDAPFTVIVVYDVSRWGRFQDVDEAAYHEHTCRRAGIRVVYCAEQFQNDGSALASLLKGIKRTMAAEYSRELSEKVFAAQCRFIGLGFKQGGHAGFGLRRLSLASDGTPRRVLEYGESKGTVTDRVVLVLGPDQEVATVRRIYALYVEDRAKECAIARQLNSDGIASEFGRPWTKSMVNSILTNMKYTGKLVYNRRSSKLSQPRQRNAATEWLSNETAFPSIVSNAIFDSAQAERASRNRRYTLDELAQLLRDCYSRHGRVTAPIIRQDKLLPDPQLFVRAFGSLITAYDMARLPRSRRHDYLDTKVLLAELHWDLMEEVCALAKAGGAQVEKTDLPDTIVLNRNLIVRLVVACRTQPARGFARWIVKPRIGTDFTIAARYDPDARQISDYFLLPTHSFEGRSVYLKDRQVRPEAPGRFEQLNRIFGFLV